MVYGPFNLADASWAQLRLRHWTMTEMFDQMHTLVSTDGSTFEGSRFAGPWATFLGGPTGWTPWVLHLVEWWGLDAFAGESLVDDLTGESEVWLAFRFTSNDDVVYEGIYLDDIQLVKAVPTDTSPLTSDTYSSRQWALRNVQQTGGIEDADIDADEA